MDYLKDEIDNLITNPEEGKCIGIIKLLMVKEYQNLYGEGSMDSPEAAADYVRPIFEHADREMVVVMSLNSRLEPMAVEIVSIGGTDFCQIDIKNIFKHSLLNNSGDIICFHNHPSGNTTPTSEDLMLTRRIQSAGNILGIRLRDHIVIGGKEHYSILHNKRNRR